MLTGIVSEVASSFKNTKTFRITYYWVRSNTLKGSQIDNILKVLFIS